MLLSSFSPNEMVQLRKQRGGLKKFGRVGQNGQQAVNGQQAMMNPQDLGAQQTARDVGVDDFIPEDTTLNRLEDDLDVDVSAGYTQDNERVFVIEDAQSNAQAAVILPQAQPQLQPQDVCEFPAQDLDLEREVTITNTTPQILEVNTDICGNAISYRERMTRSLRAGPWVPVSGMQGPINQFVDENGVIYATDTNPIPSVVAANSTGRNFLATGPQYNVTSQQLVGRAKRGKVARRPTTNVNAQFGASLMNKFRSA